MGELTKPQIALLMDIANGERPISETYAPAKKLVAIGYAEWIERRWSADLRITPPVKPP